MSCTDIPAYDFTLVKGDDETVTFRYLADGSPVILTGSVILFVCSVPALNRTLNIDLSTSVITTQFLAADTEALINVNIPFKVVRYPSGLSGSKKTLFSGMIKLVSGGV